MEGKKVASQWVPLRQINQSFTSVCVVSSCGSLGVQYKQCEEGYKVGPSLSLLCAGRFPFVGLAAPATGWEVSPFQTQEFGAMWSIRACLYVCEVVWLSSSTWACESEGENQDEDRRYKPCYIYIYIFKKLQKTGHEQNMNVPSWHCSPMPLSAKAIVKKNIRKNVEQSQ